MSAVRIRYQTLEFNKIDIHLRTLRDNQQYSDDHGIAEKLGISSATWPLFGVVWPSSQVLAHFLLNHDIKNKRILEVGCGIGLSSLLLNHRQANITATDYHPEVEAFLKENVQLNQGQAIPFVRTDWVEENNVLGQFDLIVGSDLLYEQEHAELLSNFIQKHTHPKAEVIIVDPGRVHHARFSKMMVALGFTHEKIKPKHSDYLEKPFRGWVLRYSR